MPVLDTRGEVNSLTRLASSRTFVLVRLGRPGARVPSSGPNTLRRSRCRSHCTFPRDFIPTPSTSPDRFPRARRLRTVLSDWCSRPAPTTHQPAPFAKSHASRVFWVSRTYAAAPRRRNRFIRVCSRPVGPPTSQTTSTLHTLATHVRPRMAESMQMRSPLTIRLGWTVVRIKSLQVRSLTCRSSLLFQSTWSSALQ